MMCHVYEGRYRGVLLNESENSRCLRLSAMGQSGLYSVIQSLSKHRKFLKRTNNSEVYAITAPIAETILCSPIFPTFSINIKTVFFLPFQG